MVDTEDIKYVDSLVQEYLLFRGFTTSIKVLDSEKKTDRLKGYHVRSFLPSTPLFCDLSVVFLTAWMFSIK